MINEPYFGKYQRTQKDGLQERCEGGHQPLKIGRSVLCQKPQQTHRGGNFAFQTDTESPLKSDYSQQEKWRSVHSWKNKRMSLQVLLLLSLLIVQCGGCEFDQKSVENIKATIDSNPTGFRSVFPKDYYVVHHYTKSMLCETDSCCVFSAAVVLLDSWSKLLRNLWDEHVNQSLILELKQTLDTIITNNEHIEMFQEDTVLDQFPTLSSSPEELLKLTSELFDRWLTVGCSSSIKTCIPPTLPLPVEKKDYKPSRARLLTTRAINTKQEGQPNRMEDIRPPSSSGPLPVSCSAFVWSSLLFGLFW